MRNQVIQATACVLLLLIAGQADAQREGQELDGTAIDPRVYRTYESNWRKYARYAINTGDGYGFLPAYSKRHDNSRNLTPSQALEKLKVRWEERNGNLVTRKQRTPPREEGVAYARALPNTKIGSYGYIASAEVVKVLNGNEMLVKELWLVDNDALRKQYNNHERESARRNGGTPNRAELNFMYAKRIEMKKQQEDRDELFEETFRLIGYDTSGLRPGDRWKGPESEGFQVGVIRWETPTEEEGEAKSRYSRRNKDPRLVLSELERTKRRTIDSEGFKKLLMQHEMTVAQFVDLMRTLRESDRANAEKRILNALLPEDIPRED